MRNDTRAIVSRLAQSLSRRACEAARLSPTLLGMCMPSTIRCREDAAECVEKLLTDLVPAATARARSEAQPRCRR